jgi:hypothetical protein
MKKIIQILYREWRISRMRIDNVALCITPGGDIFVEVLIDGEWVKGQNGKAGRVTATRTLINKHILYERRYEQKDSN